MTGCTPAVFVALGCGWWPYAIVAFAVFIMLFCIAAAYGGNP